MFKKVIAASAGTILLLLSGAVTATAQETFKEGSTMAELHKAGTVRIGVKFDQPLFGLKNLRGEPVGFDVEIGKMIAKELGIPERNIKWVETVSANREAFLEQDKVDLVIATFAITPKRKEVVSFAGPYIETGQDLMVKAGNPEHIMGPDDLAGKKVCVLNGSENRQNMVANYPKVELVGFDAFSKCAEAVKNGSLSAATLSGAVILGYVSKEPEKLAIVGHRFSRELWGIGVKKGDIEFCKFAADAVKKSFEDGRYQAAYAETVGKFTPEKPALPTFDPCS